MRIWVGLDLRFEFLLDTPHLLWNIDNSGSAQFDFNINIAQRETFHGLFSTLYSDKKIFFMPLSL